MPASWADVLSRMSVRVTGPLRADLSLGPAPVAGILSNVTGRVSCDAIQYRGTALEGVAIVFIRQGDEWRIVSATAALPGETPAPTLQAHGTFFTDGSCDIHLQTDAKPQQLSALLPTQVAPLAASFTARGYSRIEATLSRGPSERGDFTVRGVVHAADVVRHDVPVDLVHASFAYSNDTMHVDDLTIVRADGLITGHIDYDVPTQRISLDGRSTLPPMAMASLVGPGVERVLSSYRIEGPVTLEGQGTVGLGPDATRDLQLHVSGEHLGWRWFLADYATFDVTVQGATTTVDNVSALWSKGHVTGSLRFVGASSTNEAGRISAELQLSNADLASVVDAFGDLEDKKAYEGTLSGHLSLAGVASPAFLQTATGSGWVGIEDGYILSVPLLGGLSKYLSFFIPGLGYASQRDFRSNFVVHDGQLDTSDAQLLGKLISIRGKGSYASNHDINLRVQVEFLKEGLTATVTRFLTSPLTKALEFELTGTAKEPHWRPVNTPDRLLNFFTESMGKLMPAKSAPRADEPTPAVPEIDSP